MTSTDADGSAIDPDPSSLMKIEIAERWRKCRRKWPAEAISARLRYCRVTAYLADEGAT